MATTTSKSNTAFSTVLNLLLVLAQIGILVVLALMLKEIHLIFKELQKVISGDNYIRIQSLDREGTRATAPWYVQVVEP